jgi:hypothetical protein
MLARMTRQAWAAALIAAAALGAAAERLPSAVQDAYRHTTQPRGSALQRDLEPTYSPQRYLFSLATGAMSLIPRNATYSVALGDGPDIPDIVRDGLVQLLWYALLPRRYTSDFQSAQYIITWDHPSESLGVRVKRETGVGSDGNVVEVGR